MIIKGKYVEMAEKKDNDLPMMYELCSRNECIKCTEIIYNGGRK